jgi:predicted Zn-dependent peptidase
MAKIYRYPLFMVFLVLLIASTVPAQNLEGRVVEHALKNGMKVLMVERHEAPVVSFHVLFDVGASDETVGITGIAHMLEHLAFKGSKTIGTKDYEKEKPLLEKLDKIVLQLREERARGEKANSTKLQELEKEFEEAQAAAGQFVVTDEFSQVLQVNGGVGLNASTSQDGTRYFVSLPSNKVELWALLESDRIANLIPREFYSEQDVVLEERRLRTDSSPVGKLFEQFQALAFNAHPYHTPIIGWESDMRNYTPEKVMTFYKKYYVPENATVAIVGDINPQEVMGLMDKYFGVIPPASKPLKVQTIEPSQVGEKRLEVEWDSNPHIVIGYHKPDVNHPDEPIFDVISAILSDGRTSRFYKNLIEKRIATNADSFTGYPGDKYPNLFSMMGTPLAPHTTKEIEDAIYAELEKLKTEPVSTEELQKVINNEEASFITALASNSGLASQLAYFQAVTGDWRNLEKHFDKIKAVTPEDIMRVAKQYFTKTNRTVTYIVKKEKQQG